MVLQLRQHRCSYRENKRSTDFDRNLHKHHANFQSSFQLKITYPVIDGFGQQLLLLPNFYGATYAENTGKLENFRVFKLTYIVKIGSDQYEEVKPKILAYTRHLNTWLQEESNNLPVNAMLETWYGLEEASNANIKEILPRLGVSLLLMAIFTLISCARKECVK